MSMFNQIYLFQSSSDDARLTTSFVSADDVKLINDDKKDPVKALRTMLVLLLLFSF